MCSFFPLRGEELHYTSYWGLCPQTPSIGALKAPRLTGPLEGALLYRGLCPLGPGHYSPGYWGPQGPKVNREP